MECDAHPWMANLIALCDGRATGRDLLRVLVENEVLPRGIAEEEFARAAAGLVSGGSSKWKGSGRLGQQDNQLQLGSGEIAGHVNGEIARPADGLPCDARLAQAEILVVQLHGNRTGRLGHVRQRNAGKACRTRCSMWLAEHTFSR